MENNFEQYGTLLGSASEVAEAYLDMEGGAFFLAWAGELIQDLADKGYCRSACLTDQRLCGAVGVDRVLAESDELESEEKQVWLNMFAGVLMDHVTTAAT